MPQSQIDAVLSDVSPTVSGLLKTCAKLTHHEGSASALDIDACIKKMVRLNILCKGILTFIQCDEITELESRNNCVTSEEDLKSEEELCK